MGSGGRSGGLGGRNYESGGRVLGDGEGQVKDCFAQAVSSAVEQAAPPAPTRSRRKRPPRL